MEMLQETIGSLKRKPEIDFFLIYDKFSPKERISNCLKEQI